MPEFIKSLWREFGINGSIFNIGMPHITLNGAGVFASISEIKTCAVT